MIFKLIDCVSKHVIISGDFHVKKKKKPGTETKDEDFKIIEIDERNEFTEWKRTNLSKTALSEKTPQDTGQGSLQVEKQGRAGLV